MLRYQSSPATTGIVAVATGIVVILAIVLVVLFFARGGPFGTFNDICNGLAGVLSGLLAWLLFMQFPARSPSAGLLAFALAVVGAGLVVVGTDLVIFRITGWVLAGWYTAAGNALIGVWLALFCYSRQSSTTLPVGLGTFGLITGLLMAAGLFAIPGIIARIDSMASLPWFLIVSYLGFLGAYILFPVWAIWLGRTLLVK